MPKFYRTPRVPWYVWVLPKIAAILKIEIRPYLRNGSTDLREIWHDGAYWATESDRKLKFQLLKFQDGERPPF